MTTGEQKKRKTAIGQWCFSGVEDVTPAKPVIADIVTYPGFVTLEDFYHTKPARMLVSVAYCMKDLSCPHLDSNECDIGCAGCDLSQLKQACAAKSITFRIEVSNDDLMGFMDRESGRFDWVVGVACPFEIKRLAPLFWEKYRIRQLIFPLAGVSCASRAGDAQDGNRGPGGRGLRNMDRILELLNSL
jgi:hypothetical protein